MVRSKSPFTVVCDAGPLIHLDELDSLPLLGDFQRRLVPTAVWREVERHRPAALARPGVLLERVAAPIRIDPSLLMLVKALSLDSGEMEALALMPTLQQAILLTDDAAARLAGQQFGYRVHGTIGILLRAIRRGQLMPDEVLERLQAIPTLSSLHVRPALLEEIVRQVRDWKP